MAFKFIVFTYDILNYELLKQPRELVMYTDSLTEMGVNYKRVYNPHTEQKEWMEAFYVRYENQVYAAAGMTKEEFAGLGNGKFPTRLTTETGEYTLSYPVGVWSVDKTFLGIAANNAEYVALWNANAANQKMGVISDSGTPLKLYVEKITANWGGRLTGLRFYHYEANGNLCTLIGKRNTYVQFGDAMPVKAETLDIQSPADPYRRHYREGWTNYSRGYIGGNQLGVPDVREEFNTVINTDYMLAGKDLTEWTRVRVFHSESGVLMSSNQTAGNWWRLGSGQADVRNLYGNLPKHLATCELRFWNLFDRVIEGYENRAPSNIMLKNTNFAELDNLRGLALDSWVKASFRSTLPDNIDNIKKTLWGIRLQFDNSGFDAWGMYGDNYPKLRSIMAIYSNVNTNQFLDNPPQVDLFLDITHANLLGMNVTSDQVDRLAIAFESRSKKIVPQGHKILWLTGWTAPFTEKSAKARAELMVRGWQVW